MKVEIEVLFTKTVDIRVTKEVDVPESVVDADELYEWLEREENHKVWQNAEAADVEEEDTQYELNEATVLV